MTDDSELAGLDPFTLLDREAARLDHFYSSLPEDQWSRPSRCQGWSVRDVLGHLLAAEEYHQACLTGQVQAFFGRMAEAGATDLDSGNALGVAEQAGRPAQEVLAEWRTTDADTRRRFREAGDGTVDTSVGQYPNPWQAFHVAMELATHADDVDVPITDDERDARRDWRARVSRFALVETKPDVVVKAEGGRTHVAGPDAEAEVDDDELIDGVAARLGPDSRLDAAQRALLSAMP
jgi:uncharacterized protein (TIGR03083 family)